MIINGKTALIREQVQHRIDIGIKSLELHLDSQFINNYNKNLEEYLALIDYIVDSECDIIAIHMPQGKYSTSYDIDTLDGRELLYKVCDFAELISYKVNHNIIVVTHTSVMPERLQQYDIINQLFYYIHSCLYNHPNVIIGIENTTTYNFSSDYNHIDFSDSFSIENDKCKFANVELVKLISHPRCKVVLDTCHLFMCEHFIKNISKYLDLDMPHTNVLSTAFVQASDLTCLIHLADCEQHGYRDKHGLPFNRKNIHTLVTIMDIYNNLNYDCPVTIEVKENDYLNCKNYKETYETLLTVL